MHIRVYARIRIDRLIMTPNAPHHLPAKAGKACCSRSGECGCWASHRESRVLDA
jgi:hypothetical protein